MARRGSREGRGFGTAHVHRPGAERRDARRRQEGIEKELRRGRQAVELIDAMVRSAFADKPDVLGKWRVARRVKAVSGGGIAPAAELPATDATPTAA
ncbi:MAG TPA: hypothetical protein VFT29_02485 [Gemmatimonadaceae bacterium]|nr:hypothetical protein [Gemmatimonadaceae bacterium]